MVSVEAVEIIPCPSCKSDKTAPCDRCEGQREIAVVKHLAPQPTREQIIAKNLAAIRKKLES